MRINIFEAAARLKAGEVVAIPTETVYGLAASLHQPEGIQQIFSLKKRPLTNPLIIHVECVEKVLGLVSTLPQDFQKLAQAFWPGPLTLVLKIDEKKVPAIARAGLSTAGFRIPLMKITRDLLEMTGPLVMPSANLSGKPSSTCLKHVENDFGENFPVLEGENSEEGLESTILIFQKGKWVIGRLGALSSEDIAVVLGYYPELIEADKSKEAPLCPGQLFRHYAPQAKLIFEGSTPPQDVHFVLGFEERSYAVDKKVLILGSLEDPHEVAHNLYAILRQLDTENVTEAWVDLQFPREGLWKTIAERLLRAGEEALNR